jgi:hypothetical protein
MASMKKCAMFAFGRIFPRSNAPLADGRSWSLRIDQLFPINCYLRWALFSWVHVPSAGPNQNQPFQLAEEFDSAVKGWTQCFLPLQGRLVAHPVTACFTFPCFRWPVCQRREVLQSDQSGGTLMRCYLWHVYWMTPSMARSSLLFCGSYSVGQ